MLISSLVSLVLVVIYAWVLAWSLGYHGIFALVLYILWIVIYNSCWDFYINWALDSIYSGDLYNWVELGNGIIINFGYNANILSMIIIIIMGIGLFIVTIFVYVEMWDDKDGSSFILLLLLFIACMGIMAAGSNMMIFYLGWEGIGLVSLFLINFWSERVRSVKATFKVFCINKIGDCLLFYMICLMVSKCGSCEFDFIESWVLILNNKYLIFGNIYFNLVNFIAVITVIGGGVKSAQFGFHIWLLEAMEAPLGASALMHSSTLVIAGILLVYKMYYLIELSPVALGILIIWGSWTAVFAAFIACWQFELKVVLAYSTISSMGFLYMLLGLGAINEMIIYLIIHAFIKMFLFLVVGLIMTHCNGLQDVRWMGGLLSYMTYGFILYTWGAMALSGMPYLSGYYCKVRMWLYMSNSYSLINGVHICMCLNQIFTYIYLIRVGVLVFGGFKRGHRSIYRIMHPSGLLIISLFILLFIMLYTAVIWIEYTDYYYSGIKCSILKYINCLNYKYAELNWYGWYSMSLIYIVVLLLLFILIFIWHGNDRYSLRILWHLLKWFWFILFYICVWWFECEYKNSVV